MDILLLIIRALLLCVLGVAGLAKLIDRNASREAMATFGIPKPLIGFASLATPVLELTVSVGLLLTLTAQWAAYGSLVLFVIFTVLVATAYARGTTGECRCFGSLQSAEIGPKTVVRNAVLTVLSAVLFVWRDAASDLSFLLWVGSPSPMPTLARVAALLTLGMLVVMAISTVQLVRQPRTPPPWIPLSPPPAIGTSAPSFELLDTTKRSISLTHLLKQGKCVLLVFVSPGCPPCQALIPYIERWQESYAANLTIAVICTGTRKEGVAKFKGKAIEYLLLSGGAVASSYGTDSRPSALLVGADGFVLSDIAIGAEEIAPLLKKV